MNRQTPVTRFVQVLQFVHDYTYDLPFLNMYAYHYEPNCYNVVNIAIKECICSWGRQQHLQVQKYTNIQNVSYE